MDDFEHVKDTGRINAAKSKLSERSPDYFGEICVDVEDLTNLTKTKAGWLVIPLSGWKTTSKAGNTYLSIKVKRLVRDDTNQAVKPESKARPKESAESLNDDDIPF